jgi:ubiquinone/menaquinone biosynthesis C-methylase UbiE
VIYRPDELYAHYNPAFLVMAHARERVAAAMLHEAGAFPRPGSRCLEVGFGRLGCLPLLIGWGVREPDLHGIERDPERARQAQAALPGADLRVGDARSLPWPDGSFDLVVASTLFSSILDMSVRHAVAREIVRVLAPGGACLWYDFAFNNPRNPGVRGVTRTHIRELFPELCVKIRSATLAPPLARLAAPRSWSLTTLLDSVAFLRTHLVGVLVKPGQRRAPVPSAASTPGPSEARS